MRPTEKTSRLDYRVLVVVVLLAGSTTWFLVIPSWQNIRDNRAASAWQSTTGTFLVSESYQRGGSGQSPQTKLGVAIH